MSNTSRHANAGRSDFAPVGVLVWRRNWLFCPLSSRCFEGVRSASGAKIGSMRQIQNMPSTLECRNASTYGFFARKGQRARGFRNLPHTSVQRFRKCGVKPRSADQTPVLHFRDLRFCCRKSGCARRSSVFPALPQNTAALSILRRKLLLIPLENSPLNAKTAFRRFPRAKPDVPSQGLITVGTLRNNPIPVNHYSDKGQPWGAKPK